MKLTGRDAAAYFARPDPARAGLLIYGGDAMRVALKRQEAITALIGPNGDEEMRLTRIPGGDLRKDPAQLVDAVKAQGFFPGPRVAFVEDATNAQTDAIKSALSDWREGDACVIVTAGALKPASSLRKLFEGHKNAFAAAIYDDPPTRDEIQAMLAKARLDDVDRDAMFALESLSHSVGPGDFRQVMEKLALYKLDDTTPVAAADVTAVAPSSTEAALDDVLNIVAEGRTGDIGPVMSKLEAQGVQAVALCIGATRHFRQLHAAASDPGGISAGINRQRIFGPRRDRMQRQAQSWGMRRLEIALRELTDTDLQLRSTTRAPAMALMERALLRLSERARHR